MMIIVYAATWPTSNPIFCLRLESNEQLNISLNTSTKNLTDALMLQIPEKGGGEGVKFF